MTFVEFIIPVIALVVGLIAVGILEYFVKYKEKDH